MPEVLIWIGRRYTTIRYAFITSYTERYYGCIKTGGYDMIPYYCFNHQIDCYIETIVLHSMTGYVWAQKQKK